MSKSLYIMFICFLFLTNIFSQNTITGKIYIDTVKNETLKGVKITLFSKDGWKKKIRSDKNGYFRFDKVESGVPYTLCFKKKNYTSLVIESIISADQNIQMSVLFRRILTVHDLDYKGGSSLILLQRE